MKFNVSHFNSLKTRIAVATLSIFLAGIWAVSIYASLSLRRDMENLLFDQQRSTVNIVAAHIEGELQSRLRALEDAARLSAEPMQKGPAAMQAFVDQRWDLHLLFNGGSYATRADGTAIADYPRAAGRIGVNYLDREYVARPLREGRSLIGQPVIGKKAQAPVIVMGVPIRDAQGKVVGALTGVTNLGMPNFLEKITATPYGKSGGYVLISPEHRVIVTATNKQLIMKQTTPPGRNPVIDRFMGGYEGSAVHTNPMGVEMLASTKYLRPANWFLVADLPTEEAFAPIRDQQRRVWLITIVMSLLATALTWAILRRQLAPMMTSVDTLRAMSGGRLPLQALPVERQDEVGQMIEAFNHLLAVLGQREAALVASTARLRRAELGSKSGNWEYDLDSGQLFASEGARKLYGVSDETISFATFSKMPLPEYRPMIDAAREDLIERGRPYHIEFKIRSADSGEIKDIRSIAQFDRETRTLFGIIRDISETKRTEEALRLSEQRYRTTFNASLDIININRLSDGRYIDVNQAFVEIYGYTREEVIGHTAVELKVWENPTDRGPFVERLMRDGQCRNYEARFRKKNGSCFWGLMSSVVIELDGAPCILSVVRDINENKEAERKIHELAFFDQLTGLPNRALLADRLGHSMAASARSGHYHALLYIDLDNFRTLNDTLGQEMGDLLLKQVAQRLVACVRAEDTVARLGSDEFVVILAHLAPTADEAATQTEHIGEKILAALAGEYSLAGMSHHSTPSVGASLFLGTGADNDLLLKQADLAMGRAKDEGGNKLRFFDPEMEVIVMNRAALESDLREAIHAKQLLLHYQPQISGSQVTGAEALVRWRDPKRGLVSPADFIPLAEETGLILPLGKWVLDSVCQQLATWAKRAETANLTIAVNVSARQFHQDDFVSSVLAALHRAGANPQQLKIELTESILVSNVDDVIEKMFALKAKGVGFSLDDFGTGYSSLSYLRRLPLDQLKIDQSFVRDVLVDANDATIAKTVIGLAQSLGLGVIAEGVETVEQRDFLASAGCHVYQGYFFSRPLPVEEFERLPRRFREGEERAAETLGRIMQASAASPSELI